MNHTVLLVDDEQNVLEGLKRTLRKGPYKILTACTAREAESLLKDHPVDLIVSDEEMPGMSGTEFLAGVARNYPDIVRIILTGHPSLSAALSAINEGKVCQFLTKPCNEVELVMTIRRALEQKDLAAKSADLSEAAKRQSALIEEARRFRRLCRAPRKDRGGTITKSGKQIDERELLDQMEQETRTTRALVRDLSRAPRLRSERRGPVVYRK